MVATSHNNSPLVNVLTVTNDQNTSPLSKPEATNPTDSMTRTHQPNDPGSKAASNPTSNGPPLASTSNVSTGLTNLGVSHDNMKDFLSHIEKLGMTLTPKLTMLAIHSLNNSGEIFWTCMYLTCPCQPLTVSLSECPHFLSRSKQQQLSRWCISCAPFYQQTKCQSHQWWWYFFYNNPGSPSRSTQMLNTSPTQGLITFLAQPHI
jgi:hypothetical protein